MRRFVDQCVLESYSGLQAARVCQTRVPVIRCPHQVLVRVRSSSLNPLDKRMARGYGSQILNTLRTQQAVLVGGQFGTEFPLVLGRDFSGEVVDAGEVAAKEFVPGTEVFGATFPSRSGTHQEYAVVDDNCLLKKPATIDHRTASSIPYAGLTAWAALNTGGLYCGGGGGQRVLVLGGGGGVGSLATQIAVAAGAEVISAAGPGCEEVIKGMGATYLNYKDGNYTSDLISLSGFDIILDCAGLGSASKDLVPLLRAGGCVVTLDSPLMKNTDKQGLLAGGAESLTQLLSANIKSAGSGNTVRWAYFSPNNKALKHLSQMLEDKTLRPIIDRSFEFKNILDAYAYFEEAKPAGKVVVTM